jgi:hypothetical protein
MKLEPFGYQRGVELVKKIADASGSLGGRVIQVEKLLEENRTSEKFETLTNPLLITIACLLAKEPYSGPLQTKIGALLDRVLSRLCPCDAGQVIGRPELRALALEAMRQAEHQPPLPRVVDILNAAVSDAGIVIDTVAREFERVSGIVRVERASDKNDFIDFRHPYFLEYLTAEAVGEWPVENLLTRLRSEIPLWLRVAKFLPGLFARRKALASAYTFLAQLAAEARSAATEAPAIWLAGLSGVVDDRDLQQSEGARRFACEARKAVDEAAGNWSDHSRAEVLDACGLAAHPYYLKDIFRPQWIDVPEYSSRRISVANAPVTVADYARFLSSSSKDDKDLWRPEAPKDPKQRFVDKADEQGWQEQLKTPVRPVTYVTWYEAMAYCAWRTKLDKTGGIVRLPTPAEWKVIARPGGVAHEYPWGEGAPRGNYRDVGLQRPSPVGLFPACCRPRLLDFGTNICEWSQESAIAKLDEEEVLGGSWGDLTDYLRICRKERFRKREYRRPDCGFRCLLEQNV